MRHVHCTWNAIAGIGGTPWIDNSPIACNWLKARHKKDLGGFDLTRRLLPTCPTCLKYAAEAWREEAYRQSDLGKPNSKMRVDPHPLLGI